LWFRSVGGHRARDDTGKKKSREVKVCRDVMGVNPLIQRHKPRPQHVQKTFWDGLQRASARVERG
jgi:hypothetical protein